MKNFMPIIKNSRLFSGVSENEIADMLQCLSASVRGFEKGVVIFRSGDNITSLAMLLSGTVHIQKEDYWGNLSILSEVSPGNIFGEVYACLKSEPMAYNAAAVRDSTVLFLDIHKVLTSCGSACPFHARLIQNLLSEMAEKNRTLTVKMTHLSQRTTREKLLSYLSEQSQKAGSPSFDIPFTRQQLADYLSVDRSAMSSELGKMQADGLIEYDRSHFVLK